MTVVRLEFDVPDDYQAFDLANALACTYSIQPGREAAWTRMNVTVLTDFEAQREKTLLATAQYFYPRRRERVMAVDTEPETAAPATRAGSVSWRRRLLKILLAAIVVAVAVHLFGGRVTGISAAALAGAAVLVLVVLRLPHLRKHFHNPYKKGPGSLNYPGQRGLGLARPARKGPGRGPALPRLMRPRRPGSAASPPRRRGGAGLTGRSRRSSRLGGASPARTGSRRGGILRGRRHAGTTPRSRRGRSPGTGRGGAGSALAGRRAARRTSAGRSRSGRAGSRIFPGRRTGTGTGTRRRAGTGTNRRRRAGTGTGSRSRGRQPSRWHPLARRRAVTARRTGTGTNGRRPGTSRRTAGGRQPSRWHPLARRRAVTARRTGTGTNGRRPGTSRRTAGAGCRPGGTRWPGAGPQSPAGQVRAARARARVRAGASCRTGYGAAAGIRSSAPRVTPG